MGLITLPERDLKRRVNDLHQLFTPLRGRGPRVACKFTSSGVGGLLKIIATDDRTGAGPYSEESFRTSADVLRCNYYELWRGSAHGVYLLERAYFSLLEVVRQTHAYRSLLCIHTDPNDENDLKQGPHLHVSCAPDPIHHCHFPLEFGFLDAVLSDCDSLSLAMQRAIQVVSRDVLPRFKNCH